MRRLTTSPFIRKRNLGLIVIFLLLLLLYSFTGDYETMQEIFLNLNLTWLFLGFVCIFIYWIFEAITFHLMLKHCGEKASFLSILKLILSTQFFNGITPFSTGGQPFQIYILTRSSKLKASSVTSASLHNFMVYQFTLVLLGTLALCLKYFFDYFSSPTANAVKVISLLGFSLNIIVVFLLILLSSSLTLTRRLVFFILKGLEHTPLKQKIVSLYPTISFFLENFHRNSQSLMKNKSLLAKASILNLVKLLFFYLIAYFACRAIGFNHISIIQALVASAYIMLISSFIPLPGASGGSELGFMFLFGTLLTAPQVMVVMILWRFITYYFGLFIGFITFYFGYTVQQN